MADFNRFDAIVIGGGAVGLSMALALSRHRRVALVCPHSLDTPILPEKKDTRVFALNPKSVRFLTDIGAWSYIADAGRYVHYDDMHIWQQDGAGDLCFDGNLGVMVEPSVLHFALSSAIKQTMQDSNAIAVIQAIANLQKIGQTWVVCAHDTRYRAPIIIGADGAGSPIRQSLGIDVKRLDYQQTAIGATIKTTRPHGNTARQIMLPTGTLALLPIFDKSDCYYSVVWSLPKMLAKDHLDDIKTKLTHATRGAVGEILSVDGVCDFALFAQIAHRFYRDNVAIVGDGAHHIHPLAGQGLNLGLDGVMTLDDNIKRHAPKTAIVRYARTHRRQAALTMHAMSAINVAYAGLGSDVPPWLMARGAVFDVVSKSSVIKRFLQKRAGA